MRDASAAAFAWAAIVRRARERESERAADPHLALRPDPAVVGLDDSLYDEEPEAGPLGGPRIDPE